MKNEKRRWSVPSKNDGICPMDDPGGAIDFYMPLPDEVYNKWKN